MVLLLAFVVLLAAVATLGAALAKGESSDGLERALRALEHQGSAAQELAAEAERPFADRVLEPMQERALRLGRRMTGADQVERLRRKLDYAGNPRGLTIDRVISLKVLCAVIFPLCAGAYALMLGASPVILLLLIVAGLLLGFFGPDLYLYNVAEKRADQVKRSLADSVDLLTISVEAGLGFDAALQQVAHNTDGPLAEEFSRALREMQLGKGRSDALRDMAERSNVDDLQAFVGAMVQAEAFGISIGQVLRVQAKEMRTKRRQYAEAQAQKVPVKIMVPLILFILPCLFIVVMGPAAISAYDAFTGNG